MINQIVFNLSGLLSDFLLLQRYLPPLLFVLANFDLVFYTVPVLAISDCVKSKSNSSNKLAIKNQLGRRKPKYDCKDLVPWGTNSIIISRKYSSKVEVPSVRYSNESLNPWFITGFQMVNHVSWL